MYHPENLQITGIDAVSVWVTGLFCDNPSSVYALERKSTIDAAPTQKGAIDYYNSRLWADVGQLLITF